MALGNKTLEDLLSPISRQLGRSKVPEQVKPADFGPDPLRLTDGLTQPELVNFFTKEAAKIGTPVASCSRNELASCIAAIVGKGEPGSGGPCSIICADDERFESAGLVEALRAEEKVSVVNVWGRQDARFDIDAARDATFGITYAMAGIAESATVVQPCGPGCGRSISLLPLVHIAVVDAHMIAPTMREILDGYTAAGGRLPSQICMVSGPSATADIELVRVQGVHGPMYVHYVIVTDSIKEQV